MAKPEAEVDIDAALVRALLRDQHPDLADLQLREAAAGWDNVIFRLGDELTVRLPRREMSAPLVLHEQRWLPELATRLPLPIPAPIRAGRPGRGYPWAWSVGPWLPGVDAEHEPPADWDDTASRLGDFLAALHRPAPADAPVNPYRGVPLAERAERLVLGLDAIGPVLDGPLVEARWAELASARPWDGPALWLHGDLHPLNLLVHQGRLSAVIDFGDLTAGDPATDLSVAWMLLPARCRTTFREAAGAVMPVDDDTWIRARAWALCLGVAYLGGDERIAAIGQRTVTAVLADLP